MAENGAVLGANGAAVAPADALYLELGTLGLKQYGGYVREEFLRQLEGPRGVRIYTEMRSNDAVIGAVLFALEMMVHRVTWRVEGYDESQEAARLAELVRGMLMEDMSQSWPMLLSEILSFLPYGWAFHELVYKRRQGLQPPRGSEQDPAWASSRFDDGLIGWRKIPLRGQDTLLRWDVAPDQSIRGMVQQDPVATKTATIPLEKALLFRAFAWKGNPEGRSILRTSYRAWYMKTRIENYEGIGVERDLAGIPLLELPVELFGSSLTAGQAAQFAAFKTLGANVRRDEQACILWPLAYDEHGNKRYQFSLLSTGSTRQFDTTKIIERYDTRILQSVLADVIMVGQNGQGSQSLAGTKQDLFLLAITGFLDAIAEVFNMYAIPRLAKLNAWNEALLPYLVHSDLKEVDFQEFTAGIKNLAGAGFVLEPEDTAHIRSELGFPEVEAAVMAAPLQDEPTP